MAEVMLAVWAEPFLGTGSSRVKSPQLDLRRGFQVWFAWGERGRDAQSWGRKDRWICGYLGKKAPWLVEGFKGQLQKITFTTVVLHCCGPSAEG